MIKVPGYHPMREEDRRVWEALQQLEREMPSLGEPVPLSMRPRVTQTAWVRFLKWLRRLL